MTLAHAIAQARAWLLARAPRAVWMWVPCLIAFQVAYRFTPGGLPWSIPVYAAGGLLVLGGMRVVGYRVRRSMAVIVWWCVVASIAFAAAGELSFARVMCGGVLVVLVIAAADNAAFDRGWTFDKAFASGQGLTLLVWFAGNANRGTFGEEIAASALGQAYGAWADPAVVAAILGAYLAAWYNLQGDKT